MTFRTFGISILHKPQKPSHLNKPLKTKVESSLINPTPLNVNLQTTLEKNDFIESRVTKDSTRDYIDFDESYENEQSQLFDIDLNFHSEKNNFNPQTLIEEESQTELFKFGKELNKQDNEIKILGKRIEILLSKLKHNRKTGIPTDKKQLNNLIELTSEIEEKLSSFSKFFTKSIHIYASESIEFNAYKKIFNQVVNNLSDLNDLIFQKTVFIEKNRDFKLINIEKIIGNNNLTSFIDQSLQEKIQLQYLRDLFYRFKNGLIPIENFKSISVELNKIILRISMSKSNKNSRNIGPMIKIILDINKSFLYNHDITLDVSPLLNPKKIENLNLHNKCSSLVHAHISNFYFNKIESEGNGSLDADAWTIHAESYIQSFVKNIEDFPQQSNDTKNLIYSKLIHASLYSQSYRILDDNLQRNYIMENIFKRRFSLSTYDANYGKNREDPFITLKLSHSFMGAILPLLYEELKKRNIFINPFKGFNEEQMKELEAYLREAYANKHNQLPDYLNDWVNKATNEIYNQAA